MDQDEEEDEKGSISEAMLHLMPIEPGFLCKKHRTEASFRWGYFFCVFCAITSHKNENEPLPPKEKDGWPGEWRNSDDGSWQQQEWWITSPTATNIWGGEHNHSFQNLLGDVLSSACNSWSGSLCLLWLFDQHNEYVQLKFGRPGILRIPSSHF